MVVTGRIRGVASVALLTVALAVMVGVPTLALFADRPARFGWQMYTVAFPAPRGWIREADDSLREIDFLDRFAVLRGDLSEPDAVARAVCRFMPGETVVIELRPDVRGEAACP